VLVGHRGRIDNAQSLADGQLLTFISSYTPNVEFDSVKLRAAALGQDWDPQTEDNPTGAKYQIAIGHDETTERQVYGPVARWDALSWEQAKKTPIILKDVDGEGYSPKFQLLPLRVQLLVEIVGILAELGGSQIADARNDQAGPIIAILSYLIADLPAGCIAVQFYLGYTYMSVEDFVAHVISFNPHPGWRATVPLIPVYAGEKLATLAGLDPHSEDVNAMIDVVKNTLHQLVEREELKVVGVGGNYTGIHTLIGAGGKIYTPYGEAIEPSHRAKFFQDKAVGMALDWVDETYGFLIVGVVRIWDVKDAAGTRYYYQHRIDKPRAWQKTPALMFDEYRGNVTLAREFDVCITDIAPEIMMYQAWEEFGVQYTPNTDRYFRTK
jgi:hypothetical protein